MKNANVNLNAHILCNANYIGHMLDRWNITFDTLDKFKETCNSPYLYPYIFTIMKSSEKERQGFKIFYNNYLQKSGIDPLPPCANEHDLYVTIANDPVLLVTFVIAAQYYFL